MAGAYKMILDKRTQLDLIINSEDSEQFEKEIAQGVKNELEKSMRDKKNWTLARAQQLVMAAEMTMWKMHKEIIDKRKRV